MVAQISERNELNRRLEQARRSARMAKFFLALIAVALAALIGAFVLAAFTLLPGSPPAATVIFGLTVIGAQLIVPVRVRFAGCHVPPDRGQRTARQAWLDRTPD